jgi:DNA-binding NarL/FixJ family response regulator
MNPITILLAEDHLIFREGLRDMLQAETDMAVIGEAENGREAVDFAHTLRPDVVLMDLTMPKINGLEATRLILAQVTKTKILVLSSHNESAYVNLAKAIGASGYLLKQSDTYLLAEAIRDTHHGRPFICPSRPTLPDPA